MNTQALAILLNDLLTTESQSLLHHTVSGRPHVNAQTFKAWNTIKAIGQRDTNHAARLSGLLLALDLPEVKGTFSQNVGFLHYMTVEKMLPQLINEKRQQMDRYEQAIFHAGKNAKVKGELESLRDENREEQQQLEALATELDEQHAAAGATPLDQTADLQNIANVAAANAKLAEAKGEVAEEA